MAKKRWNVVIDWVDGVCADSDQVVVYAECESSAVEKARGRWIDTIGRDWPGCSIERAWVMTAERLAEFGL